MAISRRHFLQTGSAVLAGLSLASVPGLSLAGKSKPALELSLAQWSLHKTIFSGKLNHLDFAKATKQEFGIAAVEYVNQFFKDKAKDQAYLAEMKNRADGEGVTSLLIMIDGEGQLGNADEAKRQEAVENHYKWVEAAKFLGCHSIRVNAASSGSYEEQAKRAADGLRKLTEFGAKHEINVIVENHGGLSSNGKWLSEVIRSVDHPRCGTLPDFGNFAVNRGAGEWYDRYLGMQELMAFAKAVSFKTHNFDDDRPLVSVDNDGKNESDILKMFKIVLDAGYKGFVGIEYEGNKLDEQAGIKRSKKMFDEVMAELS